MARFLVYDLPTRLFHWVFVALFVTAFGIGKILGDDSPYFSLHMLAGMTLGFVVLLRIVWGLVGSSHARFSQFPLRPQSLVAYFKGVLTGDKTQWAGHNPASSWAAIVMLVLALGLSTTGYLMVSGRGGELLGEVHEFFANAFLLTALMHIAGLVVHTIRHGDPIALSMLDGKKSLSSGGAAIKSQYQWVALAFVVLVGGFGTLLLTSYDSQAQKLHIFSQTLDLSADEEDED